VEIPQTISGISVKSIQRQKTAPKFRRIYPLELG
jgi:hypothetical protein